LWLVRCVEVLADLLDHAEVSTMVLLDPYHCVNSTVFG
jgi:hypothetical protein